MSQNSSFLRTFSNAYHDITEKKLEETNEQIPYKFRSTLQQEQYIKKPERKSKSFQVQPPSNIRQNVPQPQNNLQNAPVLASSCCCFTCCEPELCGNCIECICRNCRENMCLKFEICSECRGKLCVRCQGQFYGNREVKLRSYKIKMKSYNEFHFENCQCQKCQS